MPAPPLFGFSFRDVGGDALFDIDILDQFGLVVALVGHHAKKFRRFIAKGGEVFGDDIQGIFDAGGITLVGRINSDSQHGAGG